VFVFPECHQKQHLIAAGFAAKSSVEFQCCVGAVDGIRIWTHRPSEKDVSLTNFGLQRYLCGRKKKYGLNCQAICDSCGRFLDISVKCPRSTSDIVALESSAIYWKLKSGLLAPDLCLFGDNAYLNSSFMATPFSHKSDKTKDAYNFYHSQLRINIECAFGRFVHRWSVLCAAIPMNITIAKTIATVCAMARLHNFCIDQNNSVLLTMAPDDAINLELAGIVPME
jgi:DDE superfamily endonuclease